MNERYTLFAGKPKIIKEALTLDPVDAIADVELALETLQVYFTETFPATTALYSLLGSIKCRTKAYDRLKIDYRGSENQK